MSTDPPTAPHRTRVAWITDEPPDRRKGGGNIRQAHLLEALAQVAEVRLVVVGALEDDAVRRAVASVEEVPDVALPAPRTATGRRLMELWLALGVGGSREVALTRRRRRRLRGLVPELDRWADVVVASHLGMAALLPKRRTARWIAQLHHVSSEKARQERLVTEGRRQRWVFAREARNAARVERRLLQEVDAVVVVSEGDAARLGAPPPGGADVVVVPNGVDADALQPAPLPAEPRIVMTGSLQYSPNVDGAIWFCESVLPLVRAACPDVTLDIVGREPTDAVLALAAAPGVAVHADVPEIAPWLARARVVAVPLRIGTGTRLKALEALAAGRPLVGTSIGLEGHELVDGVHALVRDDAESMAAAVLQALRDDALARQLADAGRAHVASRCAWPVVAGGLLAAVERRS